MRSVFLALQCTPMLVIGVINKPMKTEKNVNGPFYLYNEYGGNFKGGVVRAGGGAICGFSDPIYAF